MARKILLADDSVTAQNMGRKILTDAGYEVVTVNNGSAALKKILEQRPDLIVLDVYMPGYSGLEVCQRIKENRETARIPILLTVGKLEPFKPEEARRARADAFVVKPFEASELLAALTKLEDKIVPQAEPYKPGRFARAAAAVEADAQADDDTSWKERLRIPSGKKREPEPEIDYGATQGKGFRDLRVEEAGKKPRSKAKEPEAEFERPIPAGLPSDITPEEIAAITAAAARLNGTAPVADAKESPEQSAPEMPAAASAAPVEESAPVTFASAPELQTSEAPNATAGAVSITPVEPVAEARTGDIEITAPDAQAAKQASAPSEVIAPAPVGVATPEPVAANPNQIPGPPQPEPHVGAVLQADIPVVGESQAEKIAAPSSTVQEASAVGPSTESTTPAPTAPHADDEVMAALQSLMPASDAPSSSRPAGSKGSGSNDEISAALAAISAQADPATLKAHYAGPRWIAEEVALGAGEATLSLEREMEQAYATMAAEASMHASAAASVVVSRAESGAVVAEPVAESPATAVAEPEVAEPAVYAMASAAGAADAVPVAASAQVVAQEPPVAEPEQPHPNEVAVPAASFPPVETKLRITEIDTTVADAPASPAMPETEVPPAQALQPPVPESRTPETQIAEGAEEMANWKNIHDSIAGAAPKLAPSKEDAPEVESMKAEPEPAVVSPSPEPASDPKAIASIVDSVLAELRPKIVEEIARKLSADPKKG